ncbi:MAG: hypothetical protein NZ772_12415 [Cyanobacteria bacterium]|nr:hypothetical protein [Cyanobacteriota bacterium]MDW8199953.1 hypothetical protein [Cyanobacteriota bacterium SKYGB_h_bin112]
MLVLITLVVLATAALLPYFLVIVPLRLVDTIAGGLGWIPTVAVVALLAWALGGRDT